MQPPIPTAGWVLYDDSCGFCRKWVGTFRQTLLRRGFAVTPLQTEWVAQKLNLKPNDLLHDFRLLLDDGRQFTGADAYRYVLRRIWWTYPVYLVSIAPFGRWLFDWSYRHFADNRHRISRACRLPANETAEK